MLPEEEARADGRRESLEVGEGCGEVGADVGGDEGREGGDEGEEGEEGRFLEGLDLGRRPGSEGGEDAVQRDV